MSPAQKLKQDIATSAIADYAAKMSTARGDMEVAVIYLDDGAPRSAADALERAAVNLRAAADLRDKALRT